MKYIIEFLKKNRNYTSFHRYTDCAAEIFFHSIVKNSPFATNITHDFEKETCLNSFFASNEHVCHYVDWNTKGVFLPKVLDINDLDSLVNSEALFARKIDEKISRNLVEILEERILVY